ncbi:hypothetical protein HBI70_070760 [Parastagonospora nodorum]|nr:hypothetical protein HBI10_139610 [Parastagonospora nodorum]KAH4020861.1 hypothetical protein HBI13_107910 [Parastagonospora nodorum]KAH4258901.1 hypothetical protein HBI03_141290 [Parastagonospora nodorum]KAH4276396.1 hypothetical protein HBI04_108130 [Parastagonospora nodorum]KAH4608657.1 hypothetical protein HBH82_073420 [Parastagonospora nodorum]
MTLPEVAPYTSYLVSPHLDTSNLSPAFRARVGDMDLGNLHREAMYGVHAFPLQSVTKLTTRSARRNQKRSPLLRLPAEIRYRIYELIFTGATVYVLSPHMGYETKPIEWTATLSPIGACRQIHHEAKAIA